MAPIIQTEELSHLYSPGTPFERRAIENVNFEAERGEIIGIIGHTGSGKSTLIQHLNGLLKPTSGKVLFDGRDIWENKARVREIRFKVGLVFQYPEYQLFEETVYKDIAFGPGNMGLSSDETDIRVRRAAGFVGLEDELLQKSPFDLSGGEKRRVAIAGVIAMQPEVLVLDEPTAGLDPRGRDEVMGHIMEYHRENNATIILVTHSMDEIAKNVDRIIVMDNSRLTMSGTPREVFSRTQQLEAMRLAVPDVTSIFIRLRDKGLDVPGDIYTVAQAKDAILGLWRARNA